MNDEKEEVTVEELLAETIVKELGDLKKIEPGTEEHSRATEDVTKLCRLYLDDRKAVEDREANTVMKQKQIDAERDIKTDEMVNQYKYRWVDWALRGAEVAVAVGCVIINAKTFRKSWKEALIFETDGGWSGGVTRSLVNKATNFIGKKN